MDLKQILGSDISDQVVKGIGQKVGTSEKDTLAVIGAGLPAIFGMLKNNTESKEGKEKLESALAKHDGGILDNISGFLGSSNASEGSKILGHIFGDKQKSIEIQISKLTGVDISSVSGILSMLTPLAMNYLGKQNKSSKGGVGDILGSVLGGDNAVNNVLSSVLGKDSGGVMDAVTKATKNKEGLGGMLGGFFKK